MPSNSLTRNALNGTLNTLQTADVDNMAPREGVNLIDDWLKVLQDSHQASSVTNNLMQLRSLLQMPNPPSDQLKYLLANLADQTGSLSQSLGGGYTNELDELALALRTFSDQL
ncbi:hypothetical protein [Tellurirhabdus rosea]|uniref:hypothetical protein n=1 Tax=Tellurirhabdus rosea TaxID=2674997 RepID=UPI0022574E30|nr:hypothetical protein [Tellurirhabdus rosea]